VSAVENHRGLGRHLQVGAKQAPLVAMSDAKARALTMGSKQIWSEYSAASKTNAERVSEWEWALWRT
jgi:hypothetical protein